MSWDNQLEKASFRGVEFEVESIDDTLARRTIEYKFPYRDGADLEDLGREPRTTTLQAIFFGPEYESEFGSFSKLIDGGGAGTFVHPTLGQWQARLSITSMRQEHSRRDTIMATLEVKEDGTSTELPDLFSIENLSDEVINDSADVTAANTTNLTESASAAASALAWANSVKDDVAKATAKINEVRKKIDKAVEQARSLTDFENYALVKSLRKMAYSCQRLSDRAQRLKPTILAKEAAAVLPLSLMAHKLYGDAGRVTDLIGLNPEVRNPLVVPAGTEFRVYGE